MNNIWFQPEKPPKPVTGSRRRTFISTLNTSIARQPWRKPAGNDDRGNKVIHGSRLGRKSLANPRRRRDRSGLRAHFITERGRGYPCFGKRLGSLLCPDNRRKDARRNGRLGFGATGRELKPIMPVIYMTGDSAKGWAAQGVPSSVLLQKPFRPCAARDDINHSAERCCQERDWPIARQHERRGSLGRSIFLLGLLGGAVPTAAVCLPSRPLPGRRSPHRHSQSIVGWPLDRVVLLSLSPLPASGRSLRSVH